MTEKQSKSICNCPIHGDYKPIVVLGATMNICPECSDERAKEADYIEANAKDDTLKRGIPTIYQGARLDNFSGLGPISAWIDKPEGFLFTYGKCGCGKTHLACAIKRHWNEIGISSGIAFSSSFFVELRNTFSSNSGTEEQFIYKYAPPEGSGSPAIFDDIGAQKMSEYAIETWYNIIDRRYMFGHPTMFTSNMSLSEIAKISERIASRLASGIVFELVGEDRRL